MTSSLRAFDVIVIGGGPAGIGAAVAASRHGGAVALLDENPAAGGQVYRPEPAQFEHLTRTPERVDGDRLRAALAASNVRALLGHRVWSVSPGFRIDALGPEGASALTAPALIVATGASERVVPFPGWTSPGVIGLAAATLLLKSQRLLPGHMTVVAGCGPLLYSVAAGILKAGGRVAAMVDIARTHAWLARLPQLAWRPDLLRRGIGWFAALRAARVPVFSGHAIRAVTPTGNELRVAIGPVDAAGAPAKGAASEFRVDCVTVGNGLTPSSDVSRVMRARHRYDEAAGGWIAASDEYGLTSVPGLYVVGDGAGIAGAAAAEYQGQLAGLAAMHAVGRLDAATFAHTRVAVQRRLRRARRFGGSMGRMMAMRPAQVAAIPLETVVCRCEDVTRAEIERAIDGGAQDVNQVKAWTRCGMGPCQGRTCGDVVGELVALRVGSRDAAGYFTGRLPLRPVSLEAVTGEFEYADIPIPAAAPL